MAWTNSRIFGAYVADRLDNSAAIDLDLDTIKAALYDNTITPDNTVDAANSSYDGGQWATAGEVDDGTEWDAAGEPLTSADVTRSGAVVTFDAADLVSGGSSATLADVHGCLIYDDDVADRGICYNYFGGAQSVTDGVLTIQWAAGGIAYLDVS